jgi:dihydropyrimidinase
VISPPLRPATDQDALWGGLAAGDLSLVATDHVPDRVAVEKGEAAAGVPFDRISNGAPGIETMLAVVHGLGVAPGGSPRADGRPPVDDAGAAVRAATQGRDRGRPRRRLVLFDPAARRTIRQADLHHTSDFTPYEGLDVPGAVRSTFVRGRAVVRDGRAVGDRGYGQFVERGSVDA